MIALSSKQTAVTPSDILSQQRLDTQLKQLEFNALLFRKLDLERLFECLLTEGQSFVKFDGLQYLAADRGVDIMLGFSRQHRQRFELKLGEHSLGEVILMRSRAFTARDARDAERLAESLVYPLDNALEHHKAIMKVTTDPATGLRNQLALDDMLPREIRLVRRVEQPLSVILLSVDYLDSIASDHGEAVGKDAWLSVATTLSGRLRQSDLIFRSDDDNFCILLNQTDLEGALILAERLRQVVDHCVSFDNVQFVLTANAGVTELSEADDAVSVLARAGEALRVASELGPNQVRAIAAEVVCENDDSKEF
ncbi:GGDEF domain-containing protein [Granulosicoccus antarcticus]|uniref:diguanylate cyclase n=1 Tax=Granulosicoccus antarcticus IMCC3135 TaxID=1192854 RepID=A0A2Z2P2Q0_9GAMM|nr:GGDEF domain-containing protein [Granulosicoccus antarcticus]ASJ75640.1 Diguanylate cyclase DosC [Granulosicoccus antarcticus IMCC3135]